MRAHCFLLQSPHVDCLPCCMCETNNGRHAQGSCVTLAHTHACMRTFMQYHALLRACMLCRAGGSGVVGPRWWEHPGGMTSACPSCPPWSARLAQHPIGLFFGCACLFCVSICLSIASALECKVSASCCMGTIQARVIACTYAGARSCHLAQTEVANMAPVLLHMRQHKTHAWRRPPIHLVLASMCACPHTTLQEAFTFLNGPNVPLTMYVSAGRQLFRLWEDL